MQEISDDLAEALAEHMTQSLPSPSMNGQEKSFVTYTAPIIASEAPQITLLEAPSLLAASGTTGFRTWEAALFLGTYLTSLEGKDLVANQNIIEVGAGTGFLSILCSKHLNARRVLATDGSPEVIADLKANIALNSLSEAASIHANVLQWEHTLFNSVADCRDVDQFHLAIGADVTYDIKSIPALIATIRDLFELYPDIQVLIAATIRNKETFESFLLACSKNSFTFKSLNIRMTRNDEQIGYFVPTLTQIEIIRITKDQPASDPFQL